MYKNDSITVKYLSLRQISRTYSIPLSTLRRWASQRRFPLVKLSNRIKVCPIEFDKWVMQNHYKPQINGGENNGR